jgi:hypothetical protein
MIRALLLFLMCPLLVMCAPIDQKTLVAVRDGYLKVSGHSTIGEAFGKFLGDLEWTTGTTTDGQEFVNLAGKMTFAAKEVTAHIQFLFDKDGTSFAVHALDFNGVPQSEVILKGLVQKVYDNAYPPAERIVGKWAGTTFAFNFEDGGKCSITGPFGVDYGENGYKLSLDDQEIVIDSPMFAPFTFEFDDDDHLVLTNTENGKRFPLERQKS